MILVERQLFPQGQSVIAAHQMSCARGARATLESCEARSARTVMGLFGNNSLLSCQNMTPSDSTGPQQLQARGQAEAAAPALPRPLRNLVDNVGSGIRGSYSNQYE